MSHVQSFLKLFLMLFLFNTGCAYSVHDVYVSDNQPYAAIEKGDVIRAEAEQFVVMGFVQDTDYVNQAYKKLIAQCPTGNISSVTTQISTALGFFSWTHKALMQGLCTHIGHTN